MSKDIRSNSKQYILSNLANINYTLHLLSKATLTFKSHTPLPALSTSSVLAFTFLDINAGGSYLEYSALFKKPLHYLELRVGAS